MRAGRDASDADFVALEPSLAPFGRYLVALDGRPLKSGHRVEFRSFEDGPNTCECADFRTNRLGTCAHVEALRHRLEATAWKRPARRVTEILVDRRESLPTLVHADLGSWRKGRLPDGLALLDGEPRYTPERAAGLRQALLELPAGPARRWRLAASLEHELERDVERARLEKRLRRIAASIPTGEQGLRRSLYPYQREGVAHLVGRRRAILADEMGLGKTVQAIAACALLARLGLVHRVLVVSPPSLEGEWEEQIGLFTDLPSLTVAGKKRARRAAYDERRFFTLVNHRQARLDGDEIAGLLEPDVVVIDEAHRLGNWRSRTAAAIRRLPGDYAFVLTGMPVEHRLDAIHPLMEIVDPEVLGPRFRFDRRFHVLDETGAVGGYRRLDELHELLRPHVLRRTKGEVEADLPACSVRTLPVPMDDVQRERYREHEAKVLRLTGLARKRALRPAETKRLEKGVGALRMLCDAARLVDPDARGSPKLDELESLLDELLAGTHRIIVFSEWTRMLELLRERLEARGIVHALYAGSDPKKRRRAELQRFKHDDDCRLMLSSESGGTGLRLEFADIVVNLDLPWNPAKLGQRIARAWRKEQRHPVQVVNLVTDDSIERALLGLWESERRLAETVLRGELAAMKPPSGREALLAHLEALLGEAVPDTDAAPDPEFPVDADADGPDPHGALTDALAGALERFSPSLRRVDLLARGADERALVVGAVGHAREIADWFEARLGAGWRVRVATPEFADRLFEWDGDGVVELRGERHALVADGAALPDAVPTEIDGPGGPGPGDAGLGAGTRKALSRAIAPYRRTFEAAVALADDGFEEQADALKAPVLAALADALAELDAEHPLPEPFELERWSVSPPSARTVLRYA